MYLKYPQKIQAKNILHPILKYDSETKQYQGKCKLVEDVLILNGKCFTVDAIGQLPEKVAAIKSTQRTNGTTLAYLEGSALSSISSPANLNIRSDLQSSEQ